MRSSDGETLPPLSGCTQPNPAHCHAVELDRAFRSTRASLQLRSTSRNQSSMVFGCAPRWNTLYGGSSLTEDTLGRHGRAAHPHTKLPAQEAQYFEQALAPLSDLHGSQAHIGDQHACSHLGPANCWPNLCRGFAFVSRPLRFAPVGGRLDPLRGTQDATSHLRSMFLHNAS